MNMLDRVISAVAPRWGMQRARARAVTAHYDAASLGRRASTMKATRTDADAAARARARMAWYARDMVRNTPFATRAQAVICSGIVGDGIIPKVVLRHPTLKEAARRRIRDRGLQLIEAHFDSTAIDRQGRQNLYGLQRLIANTVVDGGECLVRIYRSHPDPAALPLQLDVLEPDYLDDSRFGWSEGREIRDGIEYDAQGRRVAYWLFPEHPGGAWSPGARQGVSERVPAEDVLHIYRQDRPGQMRGVTWFAPVMMRLQDLADHEDAQLMRQKIAACFAAFRIRSEEGAKGGEFAELAPGMIYDLGEDEDVKFAAPPGVEGYDEFTRSVLRSVAAGMGITYEALTGDLAQVNFSSARMGRIEMDQNISAWQWLMIIPQLLQPLADAFVDAWNTLDGRAMVEAGVPGDIWRYLKIEWQPPRKVIVDPTREISALKESVRNGFSSRQEVVRQLGKDPERLLEEIAQDRAEAGRLQLTFDSDPGASTTGTPVQSEAEEIVRGNR